MLIPATVFHPSKAHMSSGGGRVRRSIHSPSLVLEALFARLSKPSGEGSSEQTWRASKRSTPTCQDWLTCRQMMFGSLDWNSYRSRERGLFHVQVKSTSVPKLRKSASRTFSFDGGGEERLRSSVVCSNSKLHRLVWPVTLSPWRFGLCEESGHWWRQASRRDSTKGVEHRLGLGRFRQQQIPDIFKGP